MSTLLAAAATLVAAVLTVLLVRRCVRTPRLDLAAWAVAAGGLTLALAVQALGYHSGFTSLTFRVIQLSAQLIAPLALVWGLSEAVGKSMGARFAGRLALAALAVIGTVVLGTDPLNSTTFTTNWPAASTHYAPFAHYVLLLVTAVTVIWALVAGAMAAVRAGREPGWKRMAPAVIAATLATFAVQALRVSLPANAAYVLVCLAVAALAWYAASRASVLPLPELRGEAPFRREGGWDGPRGGYGEYGDDTGYGDLYRPGSRGRRGVDPGRGSFRDAPADTGFRDAPADTGFQDVGADTGGYGFYRADTGSFAVDTGGFGPDTGWYRGDTGAFGAVGSDTGGFDRLYREGGPRRDDEPRPGDPVDAGARGGYGGGPPGRGPGSGAAGVVETGDMMPVINDILPPGAASGEGVDTERLYGQIAIYTLLEGHAEDFDHLAKDVVDQVREREPDTLVFVLHGVPSAPMQRILYEVYRDSAAFEEHLRRPYVEHFEEQRRAHVLATNVIELGVRQAKVAPLQNQPPAGPRAGDFWSRDSRDAR